MRLTSSKLGLLDKAQATWFMWFLSYPNEPDGSVLKVQIPYELWCWAVPRTEWDGYPRLFLLTMPVHDDEGGL